MIVDHCENDIQNRQSCEVSGETQGENFLLNVIEPLQLGGVYMKTLPNHITNQFKPFKGCIKDFVHNSWVSIFLFSLFFKNFSWVYQF